MGISFKYIVSSLLAVFILFVLLSVGSFAAIQPVTDCQNLTTAGDTYVLQNDVYTSGVCFYVTANTTIFDGNGYTIYLQNSTAKSAFSLTSINLFSIYNSTIIPQVVNGNVIALINVTSSSNLTVANSTLVLNVSNSDGIRISSSGQVYVRNASFSGNESGSTLIYVATTYASDFIVTTSNFILNQTRGFYGTLLRGFVLSDNIIDSAGGSRYAEFSTNACTTCIVANNTFRGSLIDSGQNSFISGSGSIGSSPLLIYNNSVTGRFQTQIAPAYGWIYNNTVNISNAVSVANFMIDYGAGSSSTFENNTFLVSGTGPYSSFFFARNSNYDMMFKNNNITISGITYPLIYNDAPTLSTRNITFINNTLTANNSTVISLDRANGFTFINNTITELGTYNAVYLASSENISLSGNTITSASIYPFNITGSSVAHFNHTITLDNTFNGIPILINTNLSNYVWNGSLFNNTQPNIYCFNCANVTYTGFTLHTNASLGMYFGTNVTITSNILTNTSLAIFGGSRYNITNNTVFDNATFLTISGSPNVVAIEKNNFVGGMFTYITSAVGNLNIYNNTVNITQSNKLGIYKAQGCCGIIVNINITQNTFYVAAANSGAYLDSYTSNTRFLNNTVTGIGGSNTYGAMFCASGGSGATIFGNIFNILSVTGQLQFDACNAGTAVIVANNSFTATTANYAISFPGSGNSALLFENNSITTISSTIAMYSGSGNVYATIRNNTISATNTHLYLAGNFFQAYWNNFSGTGVWVNNVGTSNVFNTTVNGVAQGNHYTDIYGNSSVAVYDTNGDGWADGYGANEPINATIWSTKWVGNGTDYAPATTTWGCGVLNNANYQYNLSQNITSTGTCFTVSAVNITINGAGYTITTNGTAITSSVANTTVKNIRIVQGDTSTVCWTCGIVSLNGGTSTVQNSTILHYRPGIYLGSSYNTVQNNTFIEYSSERSVFASTTHSVISNNNINLSGSNSYGLYDYYGYNNTFDNNTVLGSGPGATGFHSRSATALTRVLNNIITLTGANAEGLSDKDDTLQTSGNYFENNTVTLTGVNVRGYTTLSATNITFVNNTFNVTGSNAIAIVLNLSSSVTLNSTTITGNSTGIIIANYTNNTVINNAYINVTNSNVIAIYYATNTTITNSILAAANTSSHSIYNSHSSFTNVTGNTVFCLLAVGGNDGCIYDDVSLNGLYTRNNISTAMNGFFNYNSANNLYTYNRITGAGSYGLWQYDILTNNSFNYNDVALSAGVGSSFGYAYTIMGNNISANSIGISPGSGSSGCVFVNNNITIASASGSGMDIVGTAGVNISNNLITLPSTVLAYGLRLRATSPNSVLYNNTITSSNASAIGIWLESASNTTVTYSNISLSGVHIQINSGSENNTIYKNNLSGSGYWVNNSGTGNLFNTTVSSVAQGNYYSGISTYAIYDSNGDGWADGYGSNESINSTRWPLKWIGNGTDYAPATTTWGCGNLTTANYVYNLTQNLSSASICFTITANNVTIDGQGKSITAGTDNTATHGSQSVLANAASDVTIKNLVLTPASNIARHIFLTSVTRGIVTNNSIYMLNSDPGMSLGSSQRINITDNYIYGTNGAGRALIEDDGQYILIKNNTFVINGNAVGVRIYYTGQRDSLIENNIFHLNSTNVIALNLKGTSYTNISNNIFYGNTTSASVKYAIYSDFWGSSWYRITNNTFIGNLSGIVTDTSSNVFIENNTMSLTGDAAQGILFYLGKNISITNVNITLTNTTSYGILLNSSKNTTIDYVNISGNGTLIGIFNLTNTTRMSRMILNSTDSNPYIFRIDGINAYLYDVNISDSTIIASNAAASSYSTLFNLVSGIKVQRVNATYAGSFAAIQFAGTSDGYADNVNISAPSGYGLFFNGGGFTLNNSYINSSNYAFRTNYNTQVVQIINSQLYSINSYAFYSYDASGNMRYNISNSVLASYGAATPAIFLENGVEYNIRYCNITTYGATAPAISLQGYRYTNGAIPGRFVVSNNNIQTFGSAAPGIYIYNNLTQSNITANNITTAGVNAVGLIIESSGNNTFAFNNITSSASARNLNLTASALREFNNNFTPTNRANGVLIPYAVILTNYTFNGSMSLNNNDAIFCLYCKNVTFSGYNITSNVTFISSNDSTLQDSIITTSTYVPVYLQGTLGSLVQRNNITGTNNIYAIHSTSLVYEDSKKTQVIGNRINHYSTTGGSAAIYVDTRNEYSNFTSNTITTTGISAGISLYNYPVTSRIVNNTITSNATGIHFTHGGSYYNYIENNTIIANHSTYSGISIDRHGGTQMFNNTITALNGAYGIAFEYFGSSYSMINRTTITTTGGGAGIFYQVQNPGTGINISIWDTVINAIGASTLRVDGSGANASDNISLYNTTFSNISYASATVVNVSVFNYAQLNISRLGAQALATSVNVSNASIMSYPTYSGSSGLTNYTLLLQYVQNSSTTTPTGSGINGTYYRVRNATSSYYIDQTFLFNGTTLANITAENPTVDAVIQHTNDSIPNYNFNQQYSLYKLINFTAHNSTALNVNISVFEIDTNNHHLNATNVTICTTVEFEQTCAFNITNLINSRAVLSSNFNYTIMWTNRDGSVINYSFIDKNTIAQYAQLSFNVSEITHNETLNDSKIVTVDVTNAGSISTGLLALSVVGAIPGEVVFEADGSTTTSLTSIAVGDTTPLIVTYSTTNYTAANYSAVIRFNSTSIDQNFSFIVNVSPSVSFPQTNVSVQHNTSKIWVFNYTNTGNVPLQSLMLNVVSDTLPSSWLTYTAIQTTPLQPNRTQGTNLNITIPAHYAPGNYNATIYLSDAFGLNTSQELIVTVPTNRSWYITPTQNGVSYNITSSVGSSTETLPSITVANTGNVPINFSINPLTSGYGAMNFIAANRYTDVAGQSGAVYLYTEKNNTNITSLSLMSFAVADLPIINMGLGLNFTLDNNSNADNTTQVAVYLINVTDQVPSVTNWRVGSASASNQTQLQINKAYNISALALDDGSQLNVSSAYFTVNNGINLTNYTYESVQSGRFRFEYTPRTNLTENITFFISENVSAGAKIGSSEISFVIASRPTSVIISSDSNTVTTNQSNKTNDVTLTLPVTLRVNGNVSIYNTTIFISSTYGWSASTLDYGNVTQNNTNLAINATLVIPKSTAIGNYTTNVSINYTNPDLTSTTASASFTVQVLPNADFQISINDTQYQQHGTTVTYTVTLVPQGNYNTTISLTSANATYTTQFFNGTYATTSSGHTLLSTTNASVFMRIVVPAYSSSNSTFNITGTTSLGNVVTIPVTLIIPANSTLSASASSINKSVVASDAFLNDNLINITNTGNVPVTLSLSLNGTLSTLSGVGGSGASIVPSLTILPGNVGTINFNYTTPATSGTYTGTLFANASPTLNVSVPITVSSYQFTLSAYNFTSFSGVHVGDTITLVANLLDGSTFVSNNITFIPKIGGTVCTSVSTQQISVDGDANFIVNCVVPSKSDGVDYGFTLSAIYESGARGTVIVTSANTGTVSYADVTAPAITSTTIVDFSAGVATPIVISGTDNVVITDSNSNLYDVTLTATRTATGATQTDTFNRVLGSPGDFLTSLTYATPGPYTYYITFTDTGSNSNSSYTGSFNVYQYRNYTTNLNYTNDSGSTVGAYINITLYNALNTTHVNITNGSLNATIKTDTYTINVTDRTSTLSFTSVDLLNLPTNDIFAYGQLQASEYRVLSQGLYSDLSANNIYNGIFARINASTNFRLRYNYSTYGVSNENGIRAYACYNYSLGEDPSSACNSGFVELTRTTLSTSQDYVLFDSPIATSQNTTMAIVFFSYVLVGQPAVSFAGPNITLSMNHNSTTSTTFSITSVSNAQQGGTLTGITFACINTSAVSDPCKNLTISSFSHTSLTQGLTQPFTVTVSAPQGLAPATYSGTMRYQSNLNGSSPLLYDIPISVTILSSSGYTYSATNTATINASANGDITLDTFTFTNIGNSAVPLTFSFNGTLLSDSSLTLAAAESASYTLRARAPSTLGIKRYGFTFGVTTVNYTVNVSQLVNITTVTPTTNITPGSLINISFDLFENATQTSNIIQANNAYFSSYTLEINNITCASSIGTAIFDDGGVDQFTCTAPTQTSDAANYTLTLNITRNGVTTSDTYVVEYMDQLPPTISGITRNVAFQNISPINITLTDRNNIASTMTAVISDSNGTSTTYSGFSSYNSSNTSALGLFNMSASSFTLRHNYSTPDDFVTNITYCDIASNCNSYIFNISHYSLVPFTATQSVGENSSLFSAAVQTSSGLWAASPPVFSVSFRRPGLTEEIASGVTSSSTGAINVSSLQSREYDIVANSSYMDIALSSATYNGSALISMEQIGVSGITNGKLGFNFEPQVNFTSALLTYRTSSGGDLASGSFLVCTDWNFVANTCVGTQSTVAPLNYTTSGSQFVYTINVTHFSAYILVVPPITTTTTTTSSSSSSGSSGGGGGGGASLGQIEGLLNSTVNNLSRITPSFRDEVRADTTRIEQNLYPTETARVNINLVNTGNDSRKVRVEISPELADILTVDPQNFEIPLGGAKTVAVLMTAPQLISQTVFDGFIRINYVNEIISIPVKIRLLEAPRQPPSIAMNIVTPTLTPSDTLRFQISVSYPYVRTVPATITYEIYKSDTDQLVYSDSRELNLSTSISFAESIPLFSQYTTGNYYIRANLLFTDSNNLLVPLIDSKPFTVTELFFFIQLFRIGNSVFLVWHVLVFLFVLLTILTTYRYVAKKMDERKRYHLPIDVNLLPQPGPNAGYVGYLAETNQRSFVDFESLKMHTLVAGSTGGGKSFAAQVLVEEALKKNVAVVVFDPTAQWSGFLRKNTNEALIKLYSKFRMNAQADPTAFKGNIRRVENYLEVIELKEYLKPGEITIFDCHKMTFEQIDMFVANTVSQVFMAELEESRDLKLLMVYDEVHRLLPKFGGSGAGFMQVERACREFRKWGIGVLLISQVLSDFIGQIKANINTEIQMRTRDEEDLKRLSLKYGDDLLHAVIKAEVGTGMIQNSKYNKGRPWLVSFRPVLHAVERLTEKELKEYDVYNTQLEDMADSLKQLESGFKLDILDMKIELDLAYDKLKEGKFDVVKIYCDELKVKIDKQWEKFKKKPTKRVKKLLDKKAMEKFLELAKKQHYEAASAEAVAAQQQSAQYSSQMPAMTTTKEGSSAAAKKDKIDEKAKKSKDDAIITKNKSLESEPKVTTTKAANTIQLAASNTSTKDKLSKLRLALGKK